MLRMFQPPMVSLPIQAEVQPNDTHDVKFINVLLHQRDDDKSTFMLPIDENNQIQLIDGNAVFLTNHEGGNDGDATTTASVLQLHNDGDEFPAVNTNTHTTTTVEKDDVSQLSHSDNVSNYPTDDRDVHIYNDSDGNSSDELIDVGFLPERMPVIPEAYMELMNDYEAPPPTLLNETNVATPTQDNQNDLEIIGSETATGNDFVSPKSCVVCAKEFKTLTALQRHHNTAHKSPKLFICQYCSKSFTDSGYLNKHLRRHTSEKQKPYQCSVCQASFYSRSILTVHQRIHSGVRPYKCEECNKSFVQSNQLETHRRSHDPERHFVCEICTKGKLMLKLCKCVLIHIFRFFHQAFTLKWQLTVHMRTHTGDRPFACNICDKKYVFNMKFFLNLTQTLFLYRFTQSGNLKMHRLVHSAEKQFQCTDCEKAFTTVVQLRSHRRRHTGERPVPKATCAECGKKCTNNGELKVHMRQHTGERPFACSTCNRRFLMHTHLLIHIRTHTGDKPYNCTTCPKSFSSSTMLQKHTWIHTGEKRYACRHCGKRFTQSSGRNSHQRIHEKQHGVAVVGSNHLEGNIGESAVKVENKDGKYELQIE